MIQVGYDAFFEEMNMQQNNLDLDAYDDSDSGDEIMS